MVGRPVDDAGDIASNTLQRPEKRLVKPTGDDLVGNRLFPFRQCHFVLDDMASSCVALKINNLSGTDTDDVRMTDNT